MKIEGVNKERESVMIRYGIYFLRTSPERQIALADPGTIRLDRSLAFCSRDYVVLCHLVKRICHDIREYEKGWGRWMTLVTMLSQWT